MSNLLLDLVKGLLRFRAPVEIILLIDYQVDRAYDLAVFWDMHPSETQEGLCFLLVGWWRHCCDLTDDFYQNLTAFILPLHFQKLDVSGRSLNFTLFEGKTGSQENLDDFLSFLKNLFCCVPPYDDVNVLQMFESLTFL
ncbi:hypothetical protein WISP_64863 [Willisornis vidua]|uniref:Uncharacterized protein n=1 Tax=Willisornis vidua TaxID=1566151 RepID=A0ABQ9DF01_9PASS|nr:hypothetical protein WISP_64863 [Willisornis vidua]